MRLTFVSLPFLRHEISQKYKEITQAYEIKAGKLGFAPRLAVTVVFLSKNAQCHLRLEMLLGGAG